MTNSSDKFCHSAHHVSQSILVVSKKLWMCLLSTFLFCCLFAYMRKSGLQTRAIACPIRPRFSAWNSVCSAKLFKKLNKMKAGEARGARKDKKGSSSASAKSKQSSLVCKCAWVFTLRCAAELAQQPQEDAPGCRGRTGCRQRSTARSAPRPRWISFQLGNYALYSSTGGKATISEPLGHSCLPPQKMEMFLGREKIPNGQSIEAKQAAESRGNIQQGWVKQLKFQQHKFNK